MLTREKIAKFSYPSPAQSCSIVFSIECQSNVKIVVVIVNYNSGNLLTKCIEHLLNQTRPADTIFIVDNASQDDSMNSVHSCAGLRLHTLDTNQGFASANNFAFQQLEYADYFITLNPDAFPEPDFVEKLEAAARSYPEYGSFASRMMRNENILDGAGDSYHISGLAWRNLHLRRYLPERHHQRDVFAACAGAAMYSKEVIVELGGFDESFFCYMEDVDLGYRMQLIGKRCLYVPQAVVQHVGSAITSQYPGFAAYHGHRNLVWTLVKNTPGILLPLVLPIHLLMSVVLGIIYLARGQSKVYWRAKIDAIRGLGKIWGQRDQVQMARRITIWQLLRTFKFSFGRIPILFFGFLR